MVAISIEDIIKCMENLNCPDKRRDLDISLSKEFCWKNVQKVHDYIQYERTRKFSNDALLPLSNIPIPALIQQAVDSLLDEDNALGEVDKPQSPIVPFRLNGQTMLFSNDIEEQLNDSETKFVRIVIEQSIKGKAADTDAFKTTDIYDRRANI